MAVHLGEPGLSEHDHARLPGAGAAIVRILAGVHVPLDRRGPGDVRVPERQVDGGHPDHPVSTCFDYGRKYGPGLNTQSQMVAPWFASTLSVGGGKCNDVTLPCYTAPAPAPLLLARRARRVDERRAGIVGFNIQFSSVRHGLLLGHPLLMGLHLPGLAAALGVQERAVLLQRLLAGDGRCSGGRGLGGRGHRSAFRRSGLGTEELRRRPRRARRRAPRRRAPTGRSHGGRDISAKTSTTVRVRGRPLAGADREERKRHDLVEDPERRRHNGSRRLRGQVTSPGYQRRSSRRGRPTSTGAVDRWRSDARSKVPGATITITLRVNALPAAALGAVKREFLTATSQDGVTLDAVIAAVVVR